MSRRSPQPMRLASGYLRGATNAQLAPKPSVVVDGKGEDMVVAFAADPRTRADLDGLDTLFADVHFRAPAHGDKAPSGGLQRASTACALSASSGA